MLNPERLADLLAEACNEIENNLGPDNIVLRRIRHEIGVVKRYYVASAVRWSLIDAVDEDDARAKAMNDPMLFVPGGTKTIHALRLATEAEIELFDYHLGKVKEENNEQL